MGNQESIQFPKYMWSRYKKQDDRDIYTDGNGLYAEKKEIVQDKKLEQRQQLILYKKRCQTNLPIVKIYNVKISQQKKNICSTMQKIIVYIEYIPYRISDIKSFSLDQQQFLYVLKTSLVGFQQLFNKFGYIDIKQELIGFNTKGEVRCWINKDYANNRIENFSESFFLNQTNNGSSSTNNLYKMDSKLRESVQKGMISQIWEIVKRKSNIENKELFYKLQALYSLNFVNAIKLVENLINRYTHSVISCLYFENILQNKDVKYKQFSYGYTVDQQTNKMKIVQIFDKIILEKRKLNKNLIQQPNFKDFSLYREHIDKLYPKPRSAIKIDISFDSKDQKSNFITSNTQKSVESNKSHAKNVLRLVDRTIDISLSSIRQENSHKTIQVDTQPSDKKISSTQNLEVPLQTIQKTYSCFVPNAISERYILNEIPNNVNLPGITNSRIVYQQKIGPPIQVEQRQFVNQNNFMSPPKHLNLSRKISNSRLVRSPPPLPGVLKRQPSIVGYLNQPNTPQFNRVISHY